MAWLFIELQPRNWTRQLFLCPEVLIVFNYCSEISTGNYGFLPWNFIFQRFFSKISHTFSRRAFDNLQFANFDCQFNSALKIQLSIACCIAIFLALHFDCQLLTALKFPNGIFHGSCLEIPNSNGVLPNLRSLIWRSRFQSLQTAITLWFLKSNFLGIRL